MTQYTSAIQQLYVAFFQRPADAAGLAYWEDVLQKNNGDVSSIITAFVNSAETLATYAGKSNSVMVNTIYQNLFGHDADSSGLAFWKLKMDRAEVTLGDVIKAISAAASDYDSQIFNGKVQVAQDFTAALDTPAKAAAYVNADAGKLAKSFLGAITSINSAAIAVARTGNLLGDILRLPDEPVQEGTRFYLSSMDDHLLGTSGRDEFLARGLFDVGQTDVLDGAGNHDRLTINPGTSDSITVSSKASISNIETVVLTTLGGVTLDSSAWQGVRQLSVEAAWNVALTAANSTDIRYWTMNAGRAMTIDGGHDVTVWAENFAANSTLTIGAQTPPTGVVNIDLFETVQGGNGKVFVHGGSLVNIREADIRLIAKNVDADITVTGTKLTKGVYIDLPNSTNKPQVVISDVNANSNTMGTLTTVDVLGADTITINDNALSNLRIANGSVKVTINNAGLTNSTNTALNLALNNATVALNEAGVYQTLNLNANAVGMEDANGMSISNQYVYNKFANNQFSAAQMPSVKTLNLSGYSGFALKAADIPSLNKITVTSAASLLANDLAQSSNLNLIDASAGYGSNVVNFDASHTAFKGGSGNEWITASGSAIAQAINLGAGDDILQINTTNALPNAALDGGSGVNTLGLHLQDAANLSKTSDFATQIHNFQTLKLDQLNSSQSIDVAKLGHFDTVQLAGTNTIQNTTLNNFGANTALQLTAASTNTVVVNNPAFVAGSNDHLLLKVGGDLGTIFAAGTVSAQHVEAVQIEQVGAIDWRESGSFALTLQADALTSLTGNARSVVTLQDNATGKINLNMQYFNGALSWASAAISAADIFTSGECYFDFSQAQSNAVIKLSGNGNLVVTVDNPVQLFISNNSERIIKQWHGNSSLNAITSVTNEGYLKIDLPVLGQASFASNKVVLAANATLQNYADAVVAQAGNASVNAAGGWFQFGGDTYYEQSHHDAHSKAGFVAGTDFIIKLTGLHDMSQAVILPVSNELGFGG